MSQQQHQKRVSLGELCKEHGIIQTGPFGSQLHASDYSDSGVAVVMPQDISPRGFIDRSKTSKVPETIAQRLSRHLLRENDIVYSRRGDVEKCALVTNNDLPALCGTGCLLVRVTPDAASARFLNYRLSMSETRTWISQHAVGATMPNLNTAVLSAVPLTVPPLREQQAIAEVLGALDDKIAANQTLASTLASLSQSRFDQCRKSARTVRQLSEITSTQYGLTTSASDSGEIRLLRVTDINKNPWVDWQSAPFAATPTPEEQERYLLREGDILVARMADPGKVAYIEAGDPQAVFASYLIRVQPSPEVLPLYLFHFMRSREYQDFVSANSAGSVQKNINAKKIVAASIPLVSTAAMQEFSAVTKNCHAAMTATLRESGALVRFRDTLLPALMDGRLRVRDAIEQVEEVL